MRASRISVLVTAMAIAVTGVVSAAAPAQADIRNCPGGNVCMWEDSNFSSDMYVSQMVRPGQYEIDWWNGDNEISSLVNNGGCQVVVYDGDALTGSALVVPPHRQYADLDSIGWDNRAQSFEVLC
jgi:hypothetical protein